MFNGFAKYYHTVQNICMTFPFPFYMLIAEIYLKRGFENWIIINIFIRVFKGLRIILLEKGT